ncbi:hypothetical protein BD626DRAFT_522989, partial [Schizophyllum amplum]
MNTIVQTYGECRVVPADFRLRSNGCLLADELEFWPESRRSSSSHAWILGI